MPDLHPTKQKSEHLRQFDRMAMLVGLGLLLIVVVDILVTSVWHAKEPSSSPGDAPLVLEPDRPRHLVDFSLVDQSGRIVTQSDLAHKVVVVNFLFTSCTVICPFINGQIAKIQRLVAADPDVVFVTLTVDPVDDTVPVLAKYCQQFGENPGHPGRWSFLTGEVSMIRQFIGTSFLSPDTSGNYGYMPGNFANTQYIVLVDPKGQIRKYFNGLNADAADAVAQEINKVRSLEP